MSTNSHIPSSSNDIPASAVYIPGGNVVAVQAGNATTDTGGNTYAPMVIDDSSKGETAIALAAGKATDTVIKPTAGRLGRILVTTVGSNAMQIYDNASGHTGMIIGQLPASAPLGPVESGFPAQNGITVAGNASNPGVTISFI